MPKSGHGADGRLTFLVVKRHGSPFQHWRNLLTLKSLRENLTMCGWLNLGWRFQLPF
jgi:hypothetical protein